MRCSRTILALGVVVAMLMTLRARSAVAQQNVDLELSLLVDTSGSVDDQGFDLQQQGYVDAFNNPAVANGIANGPLGRIAVTLIDWDSEPTQAVPWTLIDGSPGNTAGDFATLVSNWSGSAGGGTALTEAINSVSDPSADTMVISFSENQYSGARRVIDISTDGNPDSESSAAQAAEDALNGDVSTINAIGIASADVEFLEDEIIGGEGAFLVTAEGFEDFADAILDKLLEEITGGAGQQATVQSARNDVPLQFDVGQYLSRSQWTNLGTRLEERRGDRQGGVMLVDASRWYMPPSMQGTLAAAEKLNGSNSVVPGAMPMHALAQAEKQQPNEPIDGEADPARSLSETTIDPEKDRFSVFATGRVIWGEQDATTDGADFVVGGGTVGLDYRLTREVIVGIAGGYDNTDIDTQFGGDLDIDAPSVSLYGTWTPTDHLYFDGAVTYSYLEYHQERRFAAGGGAIQQANSDTNGHQFAVQKRVGYDFTHERFVISPHGSLAWVHNETDGYDESGPAGLSIDDQDADSLQTRLGVSISYLGEIQGHRVMPHVRAAWVHEFMDDSRTITGDFGGTPISFATSDPDRDFVEVGGGVITRVNNNTEVFVNYDAVVGNSDYTSHAVSAGAKFVF